MSVVQDAGRAVLELVAADPLSNMVVMLGDFNIQAGGLRWTMQFRERNHSTTRQESFGHRGQRCGV